MIGENCFLKWSIWVFHESVNRLSILLEVFLEQTWQKVSGYSTSTSTMFGQPRVNNMKINFWLLTRLDIESMYMRNNLGPKIDPCGTPHFISFLLQSHHHASLKGGDLFIPINTRFKKLKIRMRGVVDFIAITLWQNWEVRGFFSRYFRICQS